MVWWKAGKTGNCSLYKKQPNKIHKKNTTVLRLTPAKYHYKESGFPLWEAKLSRHEIWLKFNQIEHCPKIKGAQYPLKTFESQWHMWKINMADWEKPHGWKPAACQQSDDERRWRKEAVAHYMLYQFTQNSHSKYDFNTTIW